MFRNQIPGHRLIYGSIQIRNSAFQQVNEALEFRVFVHTLTCRLDYILETENVDKRYSAIVKFDLWHYPSLYT